MGLYDLLEHTPWCLSRRVNPWGRAAPRLSVGDLLLPREGRPEQTWQQPIYT